MKAQVTNEEKAARRPAPPFRANPLLTPELHTRSRRRFFTISIVAHVLFLGVVLILPQRFASKDDDPEPIEIVFYERQADDPVAPPPPKVPEPEPEPERVEPPKPRPLPPPEPKPEPEPVRQEPVVARQQPRPLPPPPEPKPEVRTDVFRQAEQVAEALEPAAKRAQVGEFTTAKNERPVATRPQRHTADVGGFAVAEPKKPPPPQPESRVVAQVGFTDSDILVPRQAAPVERRVVERAAFKQSVPEAREPSVRAREVVAEAAFDTDPAVAAVVPASRREADTVTRTSFSDSEVREAPAGASDSRSVSQGGFGDGVTREPKSRPRRQIVEELDTPVEIVSKPKPVYTNEARELRIEGDVVLEVTFVASGRLRVVRVVGGLGHGLDEAAVEAAEKIRFTPARKNGQPVDHTATLRVVFRLV